MRCFLVSDQQSVGLSRFYTHANQLILDLIVVGLSFSLAYAMRFEGWPAGSDLHQLLLWLPVLAAARVLSHFAFGIYRLVWRFVSMSDALRIARSVGVVSAVLLAIRLFYPASAPFSAYLRIPLSIIALEGSLTLLGELGIRALRRIQYSYERKARPAANQSKRVLLYGAGRAGLMLRKEMENSPLYEVVGFLDDDLLKIGTVISDTRVLGAGADLERVALDYHVDEVIISMATASPRTLARTLARCRRARIPAKIIPSLREILSGQVQISQLRDTQVEEVLGRESIEVSNFEQLAGPAYRGRRILVTGAGGSIGSELVRQLARLHPSRVAILDKDENSVYELEQELLRRRVEFSVEPQIADVRDTSRLRAIFSSFRPHAVFHAAAHKHVPLMESHPCEAILNNVAGTRNILDISSEFHVERFVFISSDKAVNPTNVMGATKRIGEMLVQAHMRPGGPRCACVRFGNVLGSRGSVVPLFKKQIAEGGPVTITHPHIERYFMTIREAVQLILCAGTMAMRGETFVLDMGNPRNILELAREMILLSGLEPDKDIQVEITGLRPGEKLTEELTAHSERLLPTSLEKLNVIDPQPFDTSALQSDISRLVQAARDNNREAVLDLLSAMGLGYQSSAPRARAAVVGSLRVVPLVPPSSSVDTCSETTM